MIDAFNSDAIPLHLITREAFELYLSRTTADGALLFHLTNRYLDLEPVVANIARDLGLACRLQRHRPTPAERRRGDRRVDVGAARAPPARTSAARRRDARWRDCRPDPVARRRGPTTTPTRWRSSTGASS